MGSRANAFFESASRNPGDLKTEAAALAKDITPWLDKAIVKSDARALAVRLDVLTTPRLAIDRLDARVGGLLSVRPMSGSAWMLLAEGRLLSGAPLDDILSAYNMAILTARREAQVMKARVDFGFRIWEFLPESMRNTVASDFVLLMRIYRPDEAARLRTVVSLKHPEVRADMRARVAGRVAGDRRWLSRYGFEIQ